MTAGDESAALHAFDEDHFAELMSWFPDRVSCQVWGGPEFRVGADNIFERLRAIICRQLGVTPDAVTPTARFVKDLGVD